jgi:hypothetical protein
MNQHIVNAQMFLSTAQDFGIKDQPALKTLATLSIAESLLSIAKSLHTLQLENEELSNHLKNGGEQ